MNDRTAMMARMAEMLTPADGNSPLATQVMSAIPTLEVRGGLNLGIGGGGGERWACRAVAVPPCLSGSPPPFHPCFAAARELAPMFLWGPRHGLRCAAGLTNNAPRSSSARK